ncbi:hypothetical protein ACFV0L_03330 [Streptosporangium canum]
MKSHVGTRTSPRLLGIVASPRATAITRSGRQPPAGHCSSTKDLGLLSGA